MGYRKQRKSGSFGLVRMKETREDKQQRKKELRKDLKKLQVRKKELIRKGEFTPSRKEYFREQEVELKKALRI